MSGFQRFFKRILPAAWAAEMEVDSRRWMQRCPCGHAVSIWDLGGIRWRATGNPRRLTRCLKCGERQWHTISKDETV